jgi:RHS repeat-associated protein
LPKGGGAIRGIGEKFLANPTTGTGSMTVPIATSPGRSGFGPQLSLSYDSAAGNGPFGFGWSLSLPSVARKTDKGLPQYLDAQNSDEFILSGAEDLVPVYRQDFDGTWVASHPGHERDRVGDWVRDQDGRLQIHEDTVDGFLVRRYRPRIEGLFARIERWTRVADRRDVHWRAISQDNILTVYGSDPSSRIVDQSVDDRPIFSWLICETRDDKGNAVLYRYNAENGLGVDLSRANEFNRGPANDPRRSRNRYLKRIYYGNRTPFLDDAGHRPHFLDDAQIDAQVSERWMFEVVFDYGEHAQQAPTRGDTGEWAYRPDPFSSYRSGFEVRTTRLCQRVLMFHHFPGEDGVGAGCLVRSTDFTYSSAKEPPDARTPPYSFLLSVRQMGYKRLAEARYLSKPLPALEFEYTRPVVQEIVESVGADDLENLPAGLYGVAYQWTDLHGEGIPGILTEQAGAWFYKRNLSPIPEPLADGRESVIARFAPLETVALKPNLSVAGAQFMDLAGDGQIDAVVLDGPTPGFYEHDEAEGWNAFRPFAARLNRDTRDPHLKFIDLDGDGRADVLVTEDDTFVWHASLGEVGFGPARRVAQMLDEEKGPRLISADGTQSIYLADMSGDGLTDLVRIRNSEVCYWPNLGYGRFGQKVTMDLPGHPLPSLCFDHQDQFDHTRIRLADIDGTGTADIIYLHRDGVRLYFNQSGNSWTMPTQLAAFPGLDDVVAVTPVDLLGNGTACLVWSSPLPGDAGRPMRYVNLMGKHKPHLLARVVNQLGAETRVHYAPSTKFYLQDKRDGTPWLTRLPFPVHVVEQVETYDRISRNRFVSRFTYHHGYFDGEEREFRGFGRVEQWDTEEIGKVGADQDSAPVANIDAASFVAPVHTKTWYHTGVYLGREHISDFFAGLLAKDDRGEYFREPGLSFDNAAQSLLPDTELPPGLTLVEEREACRALKGAMLRQEVYADDALPGAPDKIVARARTPYTVTEQNFTVAPVQQQSANRHAVFLTHPRESIVTHYERNPDDPRIAHALTLEVDRFGKVLKEAAIAYGRRQPDASLPTDEDRIKQTQRLVTYTESRYAEAPVGQAVDTAFDYRTPLPCEVRTYELTGLALAAGSCHFSMTQVLKDAAAALALDYEKEATAGQQQKRLIEHVRTLFRKDDLSALLPLGVLEAQALAGESYKLAFTPGLMAQVLKRGGQPLLPNAAAVLGGPGGDQGGYVDLDGDGNWWIPSGQMFYSPSPTDTLQQELAFARQHFFLAQRYRDPFAQITRVTYDSDAANPGKNHNLLVVRTEDAIGNTVTSVNDYRVLQPIQMTDPNGNRTELRFDALGMVVGTAVMGKIDGKVEGDSFAAFTDDLTPAEIKRYFDAGDPRPLALNHLCTATTRVLYDLERVPACAATIVRETHVSDLAPGMTSEIQLSFSYSDGFGREIQKKIQAEPGPVPQRDGAGLIVVGPDGHPQMTDAGVEPRWVGNGWTVFNNKGKPVRQFEPFFSDTHKLDSDVHIGVSPWLFYDPVGRVVATLHPNHTWEKVVFDPWRQATYDVNDTLPNDAGGADPKNDPDVGDFFRRLPDADYLPSWHALRTDPAHAAALAARYPRAIDRSNETKAAIKAGAHANTPATAHFDALGRPFLTLADNGPDPAQPSQHLLFATRVELDIEGNQRAVRDAIVQAGDLRGRIVMRYAYDLLGNRIHQASMEAGERWMVNDATGKPIRAWDSRGHAFRTEYDALRRPVAQTVRGTSADGDAASDPRTLNRDIQVDRIEYGEALANAQALNLRARIYRHFDSAGVATNARLDATDSPVEAFDFKGNLLRSTRRLASDYKAIPDWLQPPEPQLDAEFFEGSTRYDALNRPIQAVAPHSSLVRAQHPDKINVIQPVYNEANLLERVDVWLERAAEPDKLLVASSVAPSPVGVANIDYDAKGQRTRIDYRTRDALVMRTSYAYDRETFRLTHLYTRRGVDPSTAQGVAFTEDCDNPLPPPPTIAAPQTPPQNAHCGLQNLHYTYDPAGNITHIQDDAQQTVYFKNKRVEPSNDYSYDALYRLIEASGREHLGRGGAPIAHSHNDAGRVGLLSADAGGHFAPNDGNAMGTYIERYVYDAVGNFLQMQHRGSDPAHAGWTRAYDYLETSLIEDGSGGAPLKTSNRLTRTTLNPNGANPPQVEPYQHDAHGNMVRMPHLGAGLPGPNMHWDYKDQLRQTGLGGGGAAYYVYDASGQRVRKVWEKAAGLIEERIYLGGFEIFRRHGGRIGANTATQERETLHVMDDRQRIALVETRARDTAADDQVPRQLIRYQFGNHLGSASLELDDQGQIISYEEYALYGNSTYQAVRSQTETAKRYRFTGKERDEENGLNYHGARYYAPWLTRWVSADPIGTKDGPNLYVYARSNPTNLTDLTGTECNSSKASCLEPNATMSTEAQNQRSSEVARLVDQTNEENAQTFRALQEMKANAPAFDAEKWRKDVDTVLKNHDSARVIEAGKKVARIEQEARDAAEAKIEKELPGTLGSVTPLYGSGKSALVHFSHRNYGRGALYGALTISDVLLAKLLVVGGGKLILRGVGALLASEAERAAPRLAFNAEAQWGASVTTRGVAPPAGLKPWHLVETAGGESVVVNGPTLTYSQGYSLGNYSARAGQTAALGHFPSNARYVDAAANAFMVDRPWGWTPMYNAGVIRGVLEAGGTVRLTSPLNVARPATFGLELQQLLRGPSGKF